MAIATDCDNRVPGQVRQRMTNAMTAALPSATTRLMAYAPSQKS